MSVHYITWLYVYGGTNLVMLFIGLSCIIYHLVTLSSELIKIRLQIITIPFGLFMTAWTIYGAVLYWDEVAPHCSNELQKYGLANFIIHCIGWGMSILGSLLNK